MFRSYRFWFSFCVAAALSFGYAVAECAPYISSTRPDLPGTGVLTRSYCMSWGITIPYTGGMGLTLCDDCTCWYSLDMDGYFWTVNNNQTDCVNLSVGGSDGSSDAGGRSVYDGADPGFEIWCSDPERREITPDLCDGDPNTM